MGGRRLLVDTNILVLFLVGSLDPGLIAKHKRTEANNLSMQIGGAAKERLPALLGVLLQNGSFEEHVAESKEVSKIEEFRRLGLTDAGIIHLTRKEWTVLTDDLPLYLALQVRGLNAINFHHLRERMWQQHS